jgi:hypothetical protein
VNWKSWYELPPSFFVVREGKDGWYIAGAEPIDEKLLNEWKETCLHPFL